MIVIFDGMDKVGKTTLIHELDKQTHYEHIIIDRGPNSYLVYDEIYNRKHAVDYYKTEMDIANTSHLCVYCYANEDDINARLAKAGEEFAYEQGTIKEVKDKFDYYMKKSNLDTLFINTSEMRIEEAIDKIKAAIEIRKYPFIKLKTKRVEKGYIEYQPSFNSFSEEVLNTFPAFDVKVDKPYYNMLSGALTHLLHKHEIGWLNHRQIVYTSSDCISFIQIILGDTVEIIVNQRSLDLSKQGTNDLMFIYDWAKWNLTYDKLIIHYNVSIPHVFFD